MNLPNNLTNQENDSLFEQYKYDKSIRNKIIEGNLKLVAFVVNKLTFNENLYEKEDLFNIGCIGLIKAVDTFDLSKKNKFSTYATKCILNEIRMLFRKNENCPLVASLNETITDDESVEMLELILSDINIVDEYEEKELYRQLILALNVLTDLERTIVELRYGFGSQPNLISDIAKKMNCSDSNIRRIIKKSLLKITTYLQGIGIIDKNVQQKTFTLS